MILKVEYCGFMRTSSCRQYLLICISRSSVQKFSWYHEDLWCLLSFLLSSLYLFLYPLPLFYCTHFCPNLLPAVSFSSEGDIGGLSELSGVFPWQRLCALPWETLPIPAEGGDVSPWNLSPILPCWSLWTEREGHQPLHEYVSKSDSHMTC